MANDIVVGLAAESELETGMQVFGAVSQAVAWRVGRSDARHWMRGALANLERLPCRMNLTIIVADGNASCSGGVVVFNRDLQVAVDELVSRLKNTAAEAALCEARFSITVAQTYLPTRNRKAAA